MDLHCNTHHHRRTARVNRLTVQSTGEVASSLSESHFLLFCLRVLTLSINVLRGGGNTGTSLMEQYPLTQVLKRLTFFCPTHEQSDALRPHINSAALCLSRSLYLLFMLLPLAAQYSAPMPVGPAAFQMLMQGRQQALMVDPRWGPMAANNTHLGRILRLGKLRRGAFARISWPLRHNMCTNPMYITQVFR